MRNLTFLAAPAAKPAAGSFRRSFMEKTASWSVAIEECRTRGEAAALLSARKSHAFVVSAPFRQAVFEAGEVQGASARLAQGADILYRGGKNTLALSQYARVAIDEMERLFLPLYGAKAVVLGSGSSALDVVYECARAGVSEIVLLGAEKNVRVTTCLPSWRRLARNEPRSSILSRSALVTFLQLVPTTTPRSSLELLRQLLELLQLILFSAPKILVGLVLPSSLVISCATFVVKVPAITMRQLPLAVIIWQRHRLWRRGARNAQSCS